MANRIVMSATALRISKPGYDALTETNPQNLIVDGTYAGLGQYQTGTASIAGQSSATIAYSNPGSNIPFVMAQYARTSDAVGGGFYYQSSTTSTLEDTVPASRFYTTTPNSSICVGFDIYVSTANIYIRNHDTVTRTFRYVIFFPAQAGTTSSSYDIVPDAMNWTDFSGTASATVEFGGNTQTVGGLGGPITLRLRVGTALSANQSIKVKVNGTTANTLSAGSSSVSFTVQNGDVIGFSYLGSAAFSQVCNIDNISSGTNSIDTFTVTATAALDYNLENDWPNASTTASSGGSSFLVADSTSTVTTINQVVSLTIYASATLGANEYLQVYKIGQNNGNYVAAISPGQDSCSFNVVQGDQVRFRHAKLASSAAKSWTVYNNNLGIVEDTFSTTITDTYVPASDIDPDPLNWSDYTEDETWGNVAPAATTNVQTISGINTTISLRLLAAGTVPAGMSVGIYRNYTGIGSLTGGNQWLDFTVNNGDTLYFVGTCTGTNTLYQMDFSVRNLTNGNVVIDPYMTFRVKRNTGPAP